MKRIALYSMIIAGVAVAGSGCTKVLDQYPQTQTVRGDSTTSVSATDAENIILGLYQDYKNQVEFNVLDRITNGDVLSDNAYAGGDNTANITLDLFTFNSLNDNLNRDYADAYTLIGKTNIAIQDVGRATGLTDARKTEILGDAKFLRAFTYFDVVRLFGRVPLKLKPSNNSSADSLLASSLVAQSSVDSVYQQILADLWDAKASVPDIGAYPSKYTITKGPVYATLAKVYATMPTPNWDSVGYYCDQLIPHYTLLPDYTFLWDNNHNNNSEAIWEFTYDGYNAGDKIGNWAPSQFMALDVHGNLNSDG
ncbi:MAG TPA: RagB/SusD family nutrient uptake outer membrane protein [Chitinophaga sp.]